MLGLESSFWDIVEFKIIVILTTVALTVWIGNWLHDKSKE